MNVISAVELRNNLEGIVKRLRKGEHMGLTYRGEMVGEIVPLADPDLKREQARIALERIWERTRQVPDYALKAEQYLQEVYEDRKSYGARDPA